MDDSAHRCEKCGKVFRVPAHLRRHKGRKTPCMPILENVGINVDVLCRYCGRTFASKPSMMRHVKDYCKIGRSEEGMEKLFEHTLQRQLAEQNSKIDELTTLVRQLTTSTIGQQNNHVNNAPVINNNAPVININAWDGDKRIVVDIAHIIAAFTDNARLREYARLGDHELVDPAIAPPYVTELFMDLTKRAHERPEARNIYLNPRRADQALIHKNNGTWEVLAFDDATRLLLDGVLQNIIEVPKACEAWSQLPMEAQNALAMAGMVYGDEPDEYAKRARGPMAAHLSNTAPQHLRL